MFWNLAKDEQQMQKAEKRFSSKIIIWTYAHPVNSWNN